MISEEEIEKRVCELAAQISSDFAGETVKLICILKGSAFFACELAKRITVPVMIDFMQVSSYGSGTESSDTVQDLFRCYRNADRKIYGSVHCLASRSAAK